MLCSSHTFNVQHMRGVRPWTVCVLVPLVSHFTFSLKSSSLLSFNLPLCIILRAKSINYTYYKGAQPAPHKQTLPTLAPLYHYNHHRHNQPWFWYFPPVHFQSFASDTHRQEQRKGWNKSDLRKRVLEARARMQVQQRQRQQRQKQSKEAKTSDLRQRLLEARARMQVQQLQMQQWRQQPQTQRKGANTSDLRQRVLKARARMQVQQRQRRRPQQTNYLLLSTGYRDNKDLKQTQDDNF